jgi:hypothetical protein
VRTSVCIPSVATATTEHCVDYLPDEAEPQHSTPPARSACQETQFGWRAPSCTCLIRPPTTWSTNPRTYHLHRSRLQRSRPLFSGPYNCDGRVLAHGASAGNVHNKSWSASAATIQQRQRFKNGSDSTTATIQQRQRFHRGNRGPMTIGLGIVPGVGLCCLRRWVRK